MTKKQTKKFNLGLIEKLPTLNIEWPEELQNTWWRLLLEIECRLDVQRKNLSHGDGKQSPTANETTK